MSFEQFMLAQIAAIEAAIAAGEVSDPEAWIEQHAEAFRQQHSVNELAEVE